MTIQVLALIASVVVFLLVERQMKKWSKRLHPRIIDLELAWSADNARVLLRSWSTDDRSRARKVLLLDCVLPLSYATGGVILTLFGGGIAAGNGWWLGRIAHWVVLAFLVGAACDLIENICGLLMIARDSRTGEVLPRLTAIFSVAKFLVLGLAALYFLVLFIRGEFHSIETLMRWIWTSIRT